MSALRERMVREMQLRRFAPGTQEAYVRLVAELARFYRRSPDAINHEEVRSYLLHLMTARKLDWSTVNVAMSPDERLFRVPAALVKILLSKRDPSHRNDLLGVGLPDFLHATPREFHVPSRIFAEMYGLRRHIGGADGGASAPLPRRMDEDGCRDGHSAGVDQLVGSKTSGVFSSEKTLPMSWSLLESGA